MFRDSYRFGNRAVTFPEAARRLYWLLVGSMRDFFYN